MKEGDVESANDEDEDIYKDIGDFRYDRELTKLEESNKAYTEDIARLSKRINELTEKNESLECLNEILVTNISILLKTAKAELDRKQLVIDEIRKKLEALNKKHVKNERISSLRSGSFKKFADEVVGDLCKMSDVEEGEILGDDSEGKKFNPDEGKRDGSNDRGYHSSSHRKRQESHERLKGRSNDSGSSRRKSRYPDDNYSRHSSSSRSHHRNSPDGRGYTKKIRSSDKMMHSSRSSHSHGSRSRKTETSPDRKEQSSRKSRERRRSITKIDSEKLRKDDSTDLGLAEQSNKHDLNDNKSRTVKHCGTKKEKKEVENEGNSSVGKTLGVGDYRLRKSADGSSQKKSECNSLARQSVLADLYNETPTSKTLTEIPKPTADEEDDGLVPKNDSEAGSRCDWPSGSGRNQLKTKDSQVVKAPRTLYSRRMEAKFQQQELAEDGIIKKCLETSSEKRLDKCDAVNAQEKPGQNDEVETQVEIITEVVEVTEKDGETDNNEETPQTGKGDVMKADCTPEAAAETVSEHMENPTEGNPDQSFGESLVKKLLQLQNTEENVGMSEFSPLKNNYRLSKISPLKPVSKQHILEYYNLKPSSQQLPNIEPEVLDFSFPLPETPGKNFFNSFLPLNDTKECVSNRDENDCNDKFTESSPEEENLMVADTISGGESGIDDLVTVIKPSRSKKKNCKTTKVSTTPDEASSESKKSYQTSDEEIGQGKSYKTRYHMRTRSKAENDKTNLNETDDFDEKCGRRRNGSEEEGGVKRERKLTLSDEADLVLAPKRMKCETPKTENEISIEVTAEGTVPDDITSFEVFRSVSDESVGNISALVQQATRVEEKSGVDELPSWNGGDYTANKTASNEDETPEVEGEKVKPLLSSTGNSGDSSNFKVLRSYLMLSANDETDDDFGSDGNSTGSGEYSDSGASALVDLL